MISRNLPDPTVQEKIRRGPHVYMATDGVHGRYVPTVNGVPVIDPDPNKNISGIYLHQEYPKVLDRTPCPQLKDFAGKLDAEILLEHAMKDWDRKQMLSTVKNAAEEKEWLAKHANDPILTPGAYPKTMDSTPAPRTDQCNGLEDYRQKRQAWRDQISASIVHDPVEEQLWLEEHAVPQAKQVLADHAALSKQRRPRKQKAAAA